MDRSELTPVNEFRKADVLSVISLSKVEDLGALKNDF